MPGDPQPWPRMTPADAQRFSAVFVSVDTDRDGRITGEQARRVLMASKVPIGECGWRAVPQPWWKRGKRVGGKEGGGTGMGRKVGGWEGIDRVGEEGERLKQVKFR